MSIMTLFRKSPSQSLVKAPSADLIEPDSGPKIPKMVEIECELSPEQLASYMAKIGNTEYQNLKLQSEHLCHLLRKLGCKQYDKEDLCKFLKDTRTYFLKKEDSHIKTIHYEYEEFDRFLPPRIINRILEIRGNFTHPNNLGFLIQGFSKTIYDPTYSYKWHDIFFLNVGVKTVSIDMANLSTENPRSCNIIARLSNRFAIDAWRGPTFSDEEARLP